MIGSRTSLPRERAKGNVQIAYFKFESTTCYKTNKYYTWFYDEDSFDSVSASFPFPFNWVRDVNDPFSEVELGSDSAVDGTGAELANCHEGIDGLLANKGIGVEGELVNGADPRVSNRALRDLSSCCSSERDSF